MNSILIATIIVLDVALILQLLQMTFAVWADPYISGHERSFMLIVCVLVLILLAQGQMDYLVGENLLFTGMDPGAAATVATAVSVCGYVIRPVVIAMFVYLTDPDGRNIWIYVLSGINALVYIISIFYPIAISFDETGRFHRGPMGYTCAVVSFLFLGHLIILSIRSYTRNRRIDMIIPIFASAVIIGATIVDMLMTHDLPVSFLMAAIVCGCVSYYLWLHLKFAKEHETSLLAESRIRIMMSQIQPHFLYNTLASIQALCAKDPPKAAHTVEIFANYLRQNLDSLGESELIPLKKELEHTRIYTEIELLMFPEILINYQINDQNFMLPALTIQPLVENSIRHGVRGIKDPSIYITTRRDSEEHMIEIRDNGRGFDTTDESRMSGRHIGISNVRERVEKMCGGRVDVESSPGKGCTVTIHIPVKRET